MAGIDAKIFRLIAGIAFLLTASVPLLGNDAGVAATLMDFALPEYHGDKLQFILYGERAVNLGAAINLENPVIDIVQEDLTDISSVEPLADLRIPEDSKKTKTAETHKAVYPLDADVKTVSEFWEKLPHSRAIIVSPKATYDRNKRYLQGDTPVSFRARITDDSGRIFVIDGDGVGFDADQETRLIHVRSRVKFVIRVDLPAPEQKQPAVEKTAEEKGQSEK